MLYYMKNSRQNDCASSIHKSFRMRLRENLLPFRFRECPVRFRAGTRGLRFGCRPNRPIQRGSRHPQRPARAGHAGHGSQFLDRFHQALPSFSGLVRGIPSISEFFLKLDDRLRLVQTAFQAGHLVAQLFVFLFQRTAFPFPAPMVIPQRPIRPLPGLFPPLDQLGGIQPLSAQQRPDLPRLRTPIRLPHNSRLVLRRKAPAMGESFRLLIISIFNLRFYTNFSQEVVSGNVGTEGLPGEVTCWIAKG